MPATKNLGNLISLNTYANQSRIHAKWLARRDFYEKRERALERGHTQVAANLMRDIRKIDDCIAKLTSSRIKGD